MHGSADKKITTWNYIDGEWLPGNPPVAVRPPMPCGSAPRCSTARAGSMAWRPISICTASASTVRRLRSA